MSMQRSPSRGKLLLDDGELLFSALQSCLNTLSDCDGVDSSDTSGVDSSLSPPAGDPIGTLPIRRSFNFDSFSKLEVGTIVSSVSVEIERLFLMVVDDDTVFSGVLFPIYLSSVDFDLEASFGDGGGETNNEEGRVLLLLPVLFKGFCEQADLVLC